jgi:hypothetical protein
MALVASFGRNRGRPNEGVGLFRFGEVAPLLHQMIGF